MPVQELFPRAGHHLSRDVRLAELFVGQQTALAADQFVLAGRFEKLVVHADRFHQPDAFDAFDVHVELFLIAVP
ncbi:hypothetical protein FHS27_001292 [Rhodopirellula rubra]|uniref:Uncharacterized protein n=1 Tax=Aporhodopirellula rubra TaxID=980271 RepID=A0A7W5H3P2_9BACT|nr:hypothetical protein [Aporhodopirellula rubra]MBB3205492.1 hypothetical protein [Aporhodopirellula rubra]